MAVLLNAFASINRVMYLATPPVSKYKQSKSSDVNWGAWSCLLYTSKVYSVNIVYFSLGNGKDIVYHGKTEFRGIHQNDVLELTPFQKQTFKAVSYTHLILMHVFSRCSGKRQNRVLSFLNRFRLALN